MTNRTTTNQTTIKMTEQNLKLDSDEEMYFYWWLKELKERGFIKHIELQPSPFSLSESLKSSYIEQLKTKEKTSSEELMPKHIYTADVFIIWTEYALNKFTTLIDSKIKKTSSRSMQFIISQKNDKGDIYSFVEVKPSFDQNNMTRLAKLNQKWVYEKHGIYVNIVIPEKHFNKSFTPARYFFTNKSKVARTIKYKNVITIDTFFKENNMIEGFENKEDDILNTLF